MHKDDVTPEFRTQRSVIMTERWQDPVFRAKQLEKNENRSRLQREHWQDPDYRARIIARVTETRRAQIITRMQKTLQETIGGAHV